MREALRNVGLTGALAAVYVTAGCEDNADEVPIGETVSYIRYLNSDTDDRARIVTSGLPSMFDYAFDEQGNPLYLTLVLTNDSGRPITIGTAADLGIDRESFNSLIGRIKSEMSDKIEGTLSGDRVWIHGDSSSYEERFERVNFFGLSHENEFIRLK